MLNLVLLALLAPGAQASSSWDYSSYVTNAAEYMGAALNSAASQMEAMRQAAAEQTKAAWEATPSSDDLLAAASSMKTAATEQAAAAAAMASDATAAAAERAREAYEASPGSEELKAQAFALKARAAEQAATAAEKAAEAAAAAYEAAPSSADLKAKAEELKKAASEKAAAAAEVTDQLKAAYDSVPSADALYESAGYAAAAAAENAAALQAAAAEQAAAAAASVREQTAAAQAYAGRTLSKAAQAAAERTNEAGQRAAALKAEAAEQMKLAAQAASEHAAALSAAAGDQASAAATAAAEKVAAAKARAAELNAAASDALQSGWSQLSAGLQFNVSDIRCAPEQKADLNCDIVFAFGPSDYVLTTVFGIRADGINSAAALKLGLNERVVFDRSIRLSDLSRSLKVSHDSLALREGTTCLALPVPLFPRTCLTLSNVVIGPGGTSFKMKLYLRDAVLNSKLFKLMDRSVALTAQGANEPPCGAATKPADCVARPQCGWCTDGMVCLPATDASQAALPAPSGGGGGAAAASARARPMDSLGVCSRCAWFTGKDLCPSLDKACLSAPPLEATCLAKPACGMCGHRECMEGDQWGVIGSWVGCKRATWQFGEAAAITPHTYLPEPASADEGGEEKDEL